MTVDLILMISNCFRRKKYILRLCKIHGHGICIWKWLNYPLVLIWSQYQFAMRQNIQINYEWFLIIFFHKIMDAFNSIPWNTQLYIKCISQDKRFETQKFTIQKMALSYISASILIVSLLSILTLTSVHI